ncbi:MAG: 50S ribosomal protein L25, partial [Patescibacteria group bacterium]
IKSEAVQVDAKEFAKVFDKAGETGIVELVEGKTTRPVLVHDVQIHAVTNEPLHVDFMQVDLKVKVTATVQVEVEGESPAEKSGIGTLVQQLQEIEVEALPADLPEKFIVDATKLEEVDQAILVKDLDYDKSKVEVKTDPESIVAKVEPPQKEVVIEAPVETVVEGETPAVEGETPVEAPAEGGEEKAPTEGQ